MDNDQSSKTLGGILAEPMTYEDIINLFANFLQHYGLELTWIEKLEIFGDRYNLNIEYLVEILDDPKVIPMIRGKSFEFTVQSYLSEILSSQYQVTNPRLNPQAGFKDVDVCIIDTITQKRYSVECKLSKKGGFHCKKGNPFIEIKCMRSRTLGEEAARQKSVLTGIPANLLMIHNDQYTSSDFDIVITSIANAFYVTDYQGLFMWKPSQDGEEFLHRLSINNQKDAFFKMYIAKSKDLEANQFNRIECSRKRCGDLNCNFIPNYPKIYFDAETGEPIFPWLSINQIETILI